MKKLHDQDEARAALVQTVTEARETLRRTGPVYAAIVRGVIRCMEAEMTRVQIAGTIATAWAGGTPTSASKGIGARYIILARYQRKDYLPGERSPRGMVEVASHAYPSPLDALDGGESFSSVYEAWTAAVKQRAKPDPLPSSPYLAARTAMARLFVRVERDGETQRVKIEEDVSAFSGAMAALVSTPAAVQVLPPRTRHSVMQAVQRATRGRRRVA